MPENVDSLNKMTNIEDEHYQQVREEKMKAKQSDDDLAIHEIILARNDVYHASDSRESQDDVIRGCLTSLADSSVRSLNRSATDEKKEK